jgi:hypothetical protein
MHPRIREVLDYLVTAKVHLRDAVDGVPASLRDTKPAAERWSVAEVLEHLANVNAAIGRLIAKQIAKAREAGLGPEQDISSVVWSLDVSRALDRTDVRVSPERNRPTQGLTADAAWQALEAADSSIRDAVVAADGLALGEVTFPHLYLGTLNLYQWVAFAAAHEFRHAAQVREIAGQLKQTT